MIGCATALLSAAIAVTQNDLKRVMAYSTVSQLGYMFMALGAGVGDVAQLAVVAAMFHLFTHAFFKALLFLASGSVMHAMGDVIDMRRFGGLRHRMPLTCWTFAVGGLALSAIFPLSGFFSKDEILSSLKLASRLCTGLRPGMDWVYVLIYWLAIFTAFMTAFYTGRAFFMTFSGRRSCPAPTIPRRRPVARAAGRTGPTATTRRAWGMPPTSTAWCAHRPRIAAGHDLPLLALAGCTVLIGLVCLVAGPFCGDDRVVRAPPARDARASSRLGHAEHRFRLADGGGRHAGWAAGARSELSRCMPSRARCPRRLAERLRPLYEASLNKFYVDEVYQRVVVGRPVRWRSCASSWTSTWWIGW